MRYDVKKYLFVGHRDVLQTFFEEAQEWGLVHFIDPRQLKGKEVPQEIQNAIHAIKILREFPVLDQEEPEAEQEADLIIGKILDLKHAIEQLEEEKRMLNLEIARTEVFGEFSFKDIAYIEKEGDRKIRFFCAKRGTTKEVPEELIYISSDHGLDYFLSIGKSTEPRQNMVEMKIEHELNQLKEKKMEVERGIQIKEHTLKALAKYDQFLHHTLINKYDRFNLEAAKSYVSHPMEGALFAVEGWVPVNKIASLTEHLQHVDIHLAEVAIGKEEIVPTYLENKGAGKLGEDLVHIYDTPSNTDKDPSLWLLVFFSLFFAMIVGDGGYGLVYLAIALFIFYKKGPFKNTPGRVFKLFLILGSSCVLWGLFTNSFFGISFGPDDPLRRVSALHWLVEKKAAYHFQRKDEVYQEWVKKYPALENATSPKEFLRGAVEGSKEKPSYKMINAFSDGILMELILLTGIIHICLSFLRYVGRNWVGAGWVIAIIGAYLYLPQFLHATSLVHYLFGFEREVIAPQGLYMVYAGVLLAVVLAILKDKIYGIFELTNGIQIFADVLSYLRIYALGLAGAIVSQTINEMAGSLVFIAGALLVLVGHGLNMVLSIMGGAIHGLRLNFIEWYHYSFEGSGKLFNPLRRIIGG